MAKTPITLTNLPGSDRMFNIPLNAAGDYGVRSWSADTIDEDIKRSNLNGGVSTIEIVKRKTLTLNNIIYTEATRRMIEDLIGSREPITVNPPWIDADGSKVLTYLSLQKTLDDWREERTRKAIQFARSSARFNSITGRKTAFGQPHSEDAPRGQGISISDVINDAHWPSFELRSYLTIDAVDDGATTVIFVSPEDAVLWDAYNSTALVMISNEEEETNALELGRLDSVNTTTGEMVITSTDGGAALSGTANYTFGKRTYISSNLLSDGEMEDSGPGSWEDVGAPDLVEKNNTEKEVGNRCLKIIASNASSAGTQQTLGFLPADTNIVVWVRFKNYLPRGIVLRLRNTTDASDEILALLSGTINEFGWFRQSVKIAQGGAGQKGLDIRFVEAGAGGDINGIVDRIYIFENSVDNGGMEGAYVGGAGTAIAPGWSNNAMAAPDVWDESADAHGGAKAQSIDVNGLGEGITSSVAFTTADAWYVFGGFIKVVGGGDTAQIIDTDSSVLMNFTNATYTFGAKIFQASGGAGKLLIRSIDGGADFLIDDIFAVRLPGNPYESENTYDFAEPVETTGFTQVLSYKPDVANTDLEVDAFLSEISRRVWDNNAHISIYYDESTNRFRFDIDDGATTGTAIAETFSAKDDVLVAIRVDDTGAAGLTKIWAKVNQDATVTDTDSGADILGGLTRIWLGRTAKDFDNPARGTVSSVLFVNEVLTDAVVEAILDIFSGVDVDMGALLAETHGIEYEIRRGGVTTRSPAKGSEFRLADITLVELRRPGVFQIQDQ